MRLLPSPRPDSRAMKLTLEPVEDRCNPDGSFGPWGMPANLGPVVNSSASDQHPAVSKDGLSLYITTNRPENPDDLVLDDNIWVSQRASEVDPWGAPVELGPAVNTPSNDKVPTFSRDGHWMFFGSTRPGGLGGLDVWAGYREDVHDDFAWQPAVNIGPGVSSPSDDDGPTYFRDDGTGVATLYFTSNWPGQPGNPNFDISVSTQNPDGSFGPAALVPELSSPGRDTRTALRHDGREMFITSNRVDSAVNPATGLPSLDIWVSYQEDTSDPFGWSTPVKDNLEAVNTTSDDGAPAISADSQTLYFYSNRPGGVGSNDLYVTTREKAHGRSGMSIATFAVAAEDTPAVTTAEPPTPARSVQSSVPAEQAPAGTETAAAPTGELATRLPPPAASLDLPAVLDSEFQGVGMDAV